MPDTHHSGDAVHQRIASTAQLVGDQTGAFLHESLALLNSVVHADLAAMIETLAHIQATHAAFMDSLQSLVSQTAELIASQRATALDVALIHERLTTYIDSLPIAERQARLDQIDDLVARVARLEAANDASGRE